MATPGSDFAAKERLRSKRRDRLRLWLGVLIAALLCFAFDQFVGSPWREKAAEPPTRLEFLEDKAQDHLTKETILKYLDGQTISPTGATEASGSAVKLLTLKKEQIESFSMRPENDHFTHVAFTARTNQGTYSIRLMVVHRHVDGKLVFSPLQVLKASKQ